MGASTRVSTTSIKILTKGSSRFAENKSNEKQIKIDDKTMRRKWKLHLRYQTCKEKSAVSSDVETNQRAGQVLGQEDEDKKGMFVVHQQTR